MRALIILLCMIIGQSGFGQDFNIMDYGAAADGVTMNTKYIQDAIDDVHARGGGRLIVPAGVFMTGSIRMKSNVEFHLQQDAVILGSPDPADYVRINRWVGFILADGAENIALTGNGTIDGQGREVALKLDSLFYAGEIDSSRYNFVEMRPKFYLRPQLIEFVNCNNVVVRDLTLKNAACWVQTHDKSRNIVIDNVTTESDAYWNNDGIDISDCRNVRITNCFVNSADDGICLKSHAGGGGCDSIYISDCTVRSSASAIKFGTRSHEGFTNVEIRNIKVYDTFRSAVAIESVDGGVLENVLIDSVHAINTGNAIFIRLGSRTSENGTSTLSNVTIRNVYVETAFERPDYAYDIRGPELPFFHNTFPSSITGLPDHPIKNLTLENIEIRYPGRANKGLAYMPLSRLGDVPEKSADYPEFSMFGELPAWGFYIRHVEGLQMKNIRISIDEADYRPAFVLDDVRNGSINNLNIAGDGKPNKIILYNSHGIAVSAEHGILKL